MANLNPGQTANPYDLTRRNKPIREPHHTLHVLRLKLGSTVRFKVTRGWIERKGQEMNTSSSRTDQNGKSVRCQEAPWDPIFASVGAAISCGTVVQSVSPCIIYLSGRGNLTAACCGGVRVLNAVAKTTPDRQQTCKCLQAVAKKIPGFNQTRASELPGKCGVSLPIPISISTNCDNVHCEDEEYMVYVQ
ncbi:Bifunctional inhibitor/plant lipid transfer protein/seed storage helical domain-containing protein [Hirschfeldia incana]|nr:Bifunctional inhibitor/plant lipid transfer protein/seed storage helical domain-containing protein [Hirschfeldia incana]